jgi:hypothetical protein
MSEPTAPATSKATTPKGGAPDLSRNDLDVLGALPPRGGPMDQTALAVLLNLGGHEARLAWLPRTLRRLVGLGLVSGDEAAWRLTAAGIAIP